MIDIYKKSMIFYQWFFSDIRTTVAVDITNKCNLKCSHCYWGNEYHSSELNDSDMISFMKGQRKSGKRLAIVGAIGILTKTYERQTYNSFAPPRPPGPTQPVAAPLRRR